MSSPATSAVVTLASMLPQVPVTLPTMRGQSRPVRRHSTMCRAQSFRLTDIEKAAALAPVPGRFLQERTRHCHVQHIVNVPVPPELEDIAEASVVVFVGARLAPPRRQRAHASDHRGGDRGAEDDGAPVPHLLTVSE
eukprot:NODE_25626_length_580_cov_3.006623.p1 GENE.NODE_25626_length_580_cov_3.006623~~NODE_25626_length_580_cov_3.006623.p1  ORF type:complete len:152 (-),score=24.09 NODE_25626_length_580_cov_3.006623:124-534(-)